LLKDGVLIKKIAVIGSGISGLLSANLLSARYDVSLFEANNYLGGHTHTVDVSLDGFNFAIDTGFIVFNKKNYPGFCKLLQKYNIPIQKSEMSFSYRSDAKDVEYNGHSLNTLFADRRNLFNPGFYRFISEILRFNKDAKKFLQETSQPDLTVKEFISQKNYRQEFVENYLVPMIASIWSKTDADALQCSTYFILKFCDNHGLLDAYNRPEWYVVQNGSRSYIPALINNFKENIYLNTEIESIDRTAHGVTLKSSSAEFDFDAVVIATHSDQALKMLLNPSDNEKNILGAIPYKHNDVILHTDSSVMPKRRLAWASWNYLDNKNELPSLTYYMNRLQSIKSSQDFFVSVNLTEQIAADKILQRFSYAHPSFNLQSIKAQQQQQLINGKNNTYFAGSYWGYGFHEDGVQSALRACEPLGVSL
jgi:predicted NAD/FAD-binding protein